MCVVVHTFSKFSILNTKGDLFSLKTVFFVQDSLIDASDVFCKLRTEVGGSSLTRIFPQTFCMLPQRWWGPFVKNNAFSAFFSCLSSGKLNGSRGYSVCVCVTTHTHTAARGSWFSPYQLILSVRLNQLT